MAALFVLLCYLLVIPVAAFSQPLTANEELNLKRAIDLALKNQPSIQSAAYQVKASEARIGQAKSDYYPQINVSGDYTRYRPIVSTRSNGTTSVTTTGEPYQGFQQTRDRSTNIVPPQT